MRHEINPKGPVPSLIGGTLGAPKLDLVARLSNCRRCKCQLVKGTTCFAIPQLGGAFSNSRRYCAKCFNAILQKTNADLVALFEECSRTL